MSKDSTEMNCDPCQFEGTKKGARAFCNECNEFLCQECLKFHKKFQAFRHHHVLHGDSMPRTREETKQKLTFNFCDAHQMKEVQFYCSTHKSVLCTLCKMTGHSTCDCKLIEEICAKDDQAKLYNTVKKIEVTKTEFEQLKRVQFHIIDSTTANSIGRRAQLDSVRKEMNEFFDKIENELAEVEVKEKFYMTELRENVAMYNDVLNHISSLKEHMDHVSKSSDKVAIFAAKSKLENFHGDYTTVKNTITIKPETQKSWDVTRKISTVQGMFDNIKKMNIRTYAEVTEERNENAKITEQIFKEVDGTDKSEFNMNETCDNRRESTSKSSNGNNAYDKVKKTNLDEQNKIQEDAYQGCLKEKLCHQQDVNVEETHEIQKKDMLFENLKINNIFYKSINFEISQYACDITGSLFLPDGSLILCDHANSNVILLDKEFQMLRKLHFEGNPWDVALVKTNEIVVTLKSQKSLIFIKIESDRLYEVMSINLKRVPWGVAVYRDSILTTFHNNPGKGVIEIRNRHGKILRNITVDKHGEELFTSPFYVAVNQNNGNIYVTDGRKHSLTCLTFEGKPLYRMESEEFRWPRKVILDDQGNCLLCASLADKLLLIKNKMNSPLQSKEADDFKVWLKNCKRPQTVSIRREDQAMVVCLNAKNMMLVLK